jgi:hypothetical protein
MLSIQIDYYGNITRKSWILKWKILVNCLPNLFPFAPQHKASPQFPSFEIRGGHLTDQKLYTQLSFLAYQNLSHDPLCVVYPSPSAEADAQDNVGNHVLEGSKSSTRLETPQSLQESAIFSFIHLPIHVLIPID